MTDHRPVLVGMNNPISSDPAHALYPTPDGCTGNRIWQMLHERTGASKSQYLRAFDRRNLLESKVWSRAAARQAAYPLWCALDKRSVVFLGRQVVDAMGIRDEVDPLKWWTPAGSILEDGGPARWCYMPHPSGLNHWYNDGVNRAAASLRLEQLYEESIAHA